MTASLTPRGRAAVIALGLSALFALLFLDVALAAVTAALILALSYDYFALVREGRRVSVSFEPAQAEMTGARGEEVVLSLAASSKRGAVLEDPSGFELAPHELPPGRSEVKLRLRSGAIGTHVLRAVSYWAVGRLGLLRRRSGAGLSVKAVVRPRFAAAVAAAIEYALQGRARGSGERESKELGHGMEYASTRKYVPGDELRFVDWKATSRFGTLMVKEFLREERGRLHVVFDLEAPGPLSHDEMATGFFSLLLLAAREGVLRRVTVLGPDGVVLDSSSDDPLRLVAESAGAFLDYEKVDEEETYGLLDPIPSMAARRALRSYLGRGIPSAPGGAASLGLDVEGTSFVVISSLVKVGSSIIGLIDDLALKGANAAVAYPPKPWLDAATLEGAYRMRARLGNVSRSLSRHGVPLLPLPLRSLPRRRVRMAA
jgi:uncharacterized protein (DUF58 family)